MARLEELKKAKATLCSYCKSDLCEWCQVERIVSQAETELDEENDDEHYAPSSTYGDYSPSNPWDAPGMSIHDFI